MSNLTKRDEIDEAHQDKSGSEPVKRPYNKPVVSVHGDLREITLAVGDKGASDGGSVKFSKRTTPG
jgi:hypothetical protein